MASDMTALVEMRAGLLHHSGPFRNLGLDVSLELLRRVADNVDTEIVKSLLRGRVFQRFDCRKIQSFDDLFRRACWRDQAVPRRGVEALDAELIDSGQVWQQGGALERGDRQWPHAMVLDQPDHGCCRGEHHL